MTAVAEAFRKHIEDQFWGLIPVTALLLRRTASLLLGAPSDLFLRAGDALHLATAVDSGETEIWTSDRHVLAAAPHFGLRGRSA